jgi:hypothetical protein
LPQFALVTVDHLIADNNEGRNIAAQFLMRGYRIFLDALFDLANPAGVEEFARHFVRPAHNCWTVTSAQNRQVDVGISHRFRVRI